MRLRPRGLLPARHPNPGDRRPTDGEPVLPGIRFQVHRFTGRPMPADPSKVAIFPHLSEFGSELVSCLYCLPAMLAGAYRGRHSVVLGWEGRACLYRHLVDEFWEVGAEHGWLRDYCRAFHHDSKNLARAERWLGRLGKVVPYNEYAVRTAMPVLRSCLACGGRLAGRVCERCRWVHPEPGIYRDVRAAASRAVWPAVPAPDKVAEAGRWVPPNAVGVVARRRKTYGRNLPALFYRRLVAQLEDMGYSPVWLGEPGSTLPCPCPHIPDLRAAPEFRDLDLTLAAVSLMEFTFQGWTASTRLAGLVGTPFLLFESPDQLWGTGHEGMRLKLTSRGPHKVVCVHFKEVEGDHNAGLGLVRQAVREMERGDYSDIISPKTNDPQVCQWRAAAVSERRWY